MARISYRKTFDRGYSRLGLIPVAARPKAWVCGRSLAEIRVPTPPGARMFVSYACCVLSDRGLLRRAYRMSRGGLPSVCAFVCARKRERDREAGIVRGPTPTRVCCVMGGGGRKNMFRLVNNDHTPIIGLFHLRCMFNAFKPGIHPKFKYSVRTS